MKERNILQILKNSEYTVVLLGVEMILENGYPALRDGFASYDLEQKYGYCPEEIISSAFYETRKDFFFRFYKEEILKIAEELPGKGYQSLKKLQDYGLIQTIITKRIFGLADRAGCIDVINLHGTVYENICPKCGKSYSVEYIKNAKGVPLCENCLVSIRPKTVSYTHLRRIERSGDCGQESGNRASGSDREKCGCRKFFKETWHRRREKIVGTYPGIQL